MTNDLFSWREILEHLHKNAVVCRGILGFEVITIGSGPFGEMEFDEFLNKCGISIYEVSESDLNKIIMGHDDWQEDELDTAIKAREGKSLKVYSQEMVLASLALGNDLFDVCSREEIESFGRFHPALEYLMNNMGFDWPTTKVSLGLNSLIVDFIGGEWPETGVLRKMGYKVGKYGLNEDERREILDKVFNVELIPGSDDTKEYIEEWGNLNSEKRIKKMANSIASFIRNKRRDESRDYSVAINEWEEDLKYLKKKYYRKNYGFIWPDTFVRKY